VDAKWQGKGFTLPLPVIYRSSGATLPESQCDAHINCRQRHLSLIGGPHHAETAGYASARSLWRRNRRVAAPRHIRRPRCPLRSRQRCLKSCAHYARPLPRPRSFNGCVPYQGRVTPHAVRAKGLKEPTLSWCNWRPDLKQAKPTLVRGSRGPTPQTTRLPISGLKSHLSRVGATDALDQEDY
jgi:hypothetical protein